MQNESAGVKEDDKNSKTSKRTTVMTLHYSLRENFFESYQLSTVQENGFTISPMSEKLHSGL